MVCVNDVIDLVRRRYNDIDEGYISKIIIQHAEFNTYDEIYDGTKLIAIIIYNINGKILNVVDMIINDGYDSRLIMRQFATKAWIRFPYIRWIKYFRLNKYPLRKAVFLDIKRLLKIKE